jgi:HEPN domain-containing protein
MNIDVLVNDFATRSFRDMADEDYVAARMAYRAQLVPQFLWLSLQALEKYLKCILVLNRVPARKGHNLADCLKALDARCPFEVGLTDVAREFIEYVDSLGKFRYFETSHFIHGPKLVILDRTVWELRRYARPLKYEINLLDGSKKQMLQLELDAIKQAGRASPHRFRIIGGRLEKIIDSRNHPAREPLLWQNAYYGKRPRKRVRMRVYMSAANSPLTLHPEILDEVLKYVYLPKEVVEAYRHVR